MPTLKPFGPLSDPRVDHVKLLYVFLRGNQVFPLLLLVATVVRLEQSLDLSLCRLNHLLDQLALHVKKLYAEPDVLDVFLPSHHQVEAI